MWRSVLTVAAAAGLAWGGDGVRGFINPPSDGEEVGGGFTYQGYLEVDGQPANGDYYFRFSLYDSQDIWLGTWWAPAGPIAVSDGVFTAEVLMGGDPGVADQFWRDYGRVAKTMLVEVGTVEGEYQPLSPRVTLNASPHALYARQAGSLVFPYQDVYDDYLGQPATMLSLTNVRGGITAEFVSETNTDAPVVHVRGARTFSTSFGFQSGALLVDSRDDEVAIRGEGARFSVVGFFSEPPTLGGLSAAILGSVGSFSSPDVTAIWANNTPAGTSARLGTASYAGDFTGDVLARNDVRVQGEAVRDYAAGQPSPIGPLAYGFITSTGFVNSGTGNLSAVWDNASSTYRVSVDGETLVLGQHTVLVTVVDSTEPRVATITVLGNAFAVTIWDLNSGNVRVQDNFQIVIYDANPGAVLVRNAVPDGVDADKYAEATGILPARVIPASRPVSGPARLEGELGGG